MMYACLHCQCRFTSEDAGRFQEFEPTEAFGVHEYVDVSLVGCPECGSTEIDEFARDSDPEGDDDACDEIAQQERIRQRRRKDLIDIMTPLKRTA